MSNQHQQIPSESYLFAVREPDDVSLPSVAFALVNNEATTLPATPVVADAATAMDTNARPAGTTTLPPSTASSSTVDVDTRDNATTSSAPVHFSARPNTCTASRVSFSLCIGFIAIETQWLEMVLAIADALVHDSTAISEQ
ncbi:hypothetical protein CAOG_010198 [Capsaspora owczarzaki ATCC 30864]|uniref:Uncharacterized protein n=1 Tax=Capsaspora owczarzaki (strain ATCC 30864) TaxID=595528 RepID=A0A0D2WYW1_CAPO3|nr:hypothetical protein CAOG_010198 [Capsaspora owczarzaki ATCC 30864]